MGGRVEEAEAAEAWTADLRIARGLEKSEMSVMPRVRDSRGGEDSDKSGVGEGETVCAETGSWDDRVQVRQAG